MKDTVLALLWLCLTVVSRGEASHPEILILTTGGTIASRSGAPMIEGPAHAGAALALEVCEGSVEAPVTPALVFEEARDAADPEPAGRGQRWQAHGMPEILAS